MKQVMSNPYPSENGGKIISKIKMSDPTWPEEGWVKMQYLVKYVDSNGKTIRINIHYIFNKILDAFDNFKFK
ncbi:hypothetical protein ACFLYU_03515 [Candidatus Dependentiae bacterium]